MTPAISLRGISKKYRIYPRQRYRLLEALSFGRIERGHDFWALKDVNLEVERGTTLGILGRNGAGKSTLLQIISGVLQPSRGRIRVNGRLAALLQLGAGFNPEFTGRENVMMNGLIMGLERREILERFDEIEEFADLGEFMDQPVKTYSSGMRARLGFAVAVNVEPEILIVDETLSVGDAVFKHQGLQKMRELRDSGATVLFVSHGLGMVKSFCTEAVLLHKGDLLYQGDTSETIDYYNALLASLEAKKQGRAATGEDPGRYEIAHDDDAAEPDFKENPDLDKRRNRSLRHGTGEARIQHVEVLNERGAAAELVAPESTLTVRLHLEYMKDVESSIARIVVRNRAGLDIFSTSTGLEQVPLRARAAGERVIVDFRFKPPLHHGHYSITAALSHPHHNNLFMDWVDVAATFEVDRPTERRAIPGIVHLPTEVEIHSPARREKSNRPA
jgi:ABC-2 type transport system ATP-binding protein